MRMKVTLTENNSEYYCADAREIEPKEMPDFDLLCAGFPFQSFSLYSLIKTFIIYSAIFRIALLGFLTVAPCKDDNAVSQKTHRKDCLLFIRN